MLSQFYYTVTDKIFREAIIRSVTSVRSFPLHIYVHMEQLGSYWTNFNESLIFTKTFDHIQITWKQNINRRHNFA